MTMPSSPADTSRIIDRRMALAREWDELVGQVRTLKGFEDFLMPPKLEKLLPAAAAGPVVVLNISQWRCDALIVTASGVEVKELPGLTAEAVGAQVDGYLGELRRAEEVARAVLVPVGGPVGDSPPRPVALSAAAEQALQRARSARDHTLRSVLEWLWDQAAGPVLEVLDLDPPAPDQPWPRLWWCPTGPLTLMPLHAAGYHTQEGRAHRDAVLDRVVSSYTPTLRALLEAQDGNAHQARRAADDKPALRDVPGEAAGQMLIVALSDTPGQIPLPNVAREREVLTRLFAGGNTLLNGSAATWEAVRAQLPQHSWVHFSCHGDQNLNDPSEGGILLHDRMLTIADISEGRYHGGFAFLSACKTATGGITLPDEAITLAAALHYTGYRHVIGTLWSVHDQTAADVAESVYEDLTSAGVFEPSRAAYALHLAVRGLRDAGKSLSHWTPFTHTGP
jgi:CHAT domain-containing protein